MKKNQITENGVIIKKHTGLKVIILSTVAVAVCVIMIFTLILHNFFSPTNLNVKYTVEDYNSFLEKMQFQKNAAPTSGKLSDYRYIYGASNPVEAQLTSAEITAYLCENQPPWFPLKKPQVRINKDGSMELSGKLISEMLKAGFGMKNTLAVSPASLIPASLNIYIHMNCKFVDNKITDIKIYNLKIMGMSAKSLSKLLKVSNEDEMYRLIEENAASYVNEKLKVLNKISGTFFGNVYAADENIVFDGRMPSSLTIKKLVP